MCSSNCAQGLCTESLPGGGGFWARSGGHSESSPALNTGFPHGWLGVLDSCLRLSRGWTGSTRNPSCHPPSPPSKPALQGSQGRPVSGTGSKTVAEIQCRNSPCLGDPTNNPQMKELLFPSQARASVPCIIYPSSEGVLNALLIWKDSLFSVANLSPFNVDDYVLYSL